MTSLREKLYENQDFSEIETEKLQTLYGSLREYAHQQGAKMEYDEAQQALDLSNAVAEEIKSRNPQKDNEEEVQGSFTSRQSDFDGEWKKKFEDYDRITDEKKNELSEKHSIQKEEFERLWREDMPRKYRKPSHHLLQIKRIEKSLALSCQFEKAKEVHQQAQAISEQEREQQQENLIRDYNTAKKKLEEKQSSEMSRLDQQRAHGRVLLMHKYEQSKSAVDNRSIVIETRKREAQKGYRTMNRQRTAIGSTITYSVAGDGVDDVLLAPLKAPNDPDVIEAEKKRRREINKKQLEFQKQNAQATLAKYTVDGEQHAEQHTEQQPACAEAPRASVGVGAEMEFESSSFEEEDEEEEAKLSGGMMQKVADAVTDE